LCFVGIGLVKKPFSGGSSLDGSDTILYELVDNDDAMILFKVQRVRYKKMNYQELNHKFGVLIR
jgi:hypothetical protein